MDDLYDVISDKFQELMASLREKVTDGLSLGEIWTLIEKTIKALVKIANVLEASGSQKKDLVLRLVQRVYDEVIRPIDLPWVPNTLEPWIDQLIGQAVYPAADWLIDQIVAAFNTDGWPEG